MKNKIVKLKETTPDMFIRLGKADTIMLYWLKRRYSWQVAVIVNKDHEYIGDYTTSGGNFNKEVAALERAYEMLNVMPKHNLSQYHVGGNYYKVPVKEVRVWRP